MRSAVYLLIVALSFAGYRAVAQEITCAQALQPTSFFTTSSEIDQTHFILDVDRSLFERIKGSGGAGITVPIYGMTFSFGEDWSSFSSKQESLRSNVIFDRSVANSSTTAYSYLASANLDAFVQCMTLQSVGLHVALIRNARSTATVDVFFGTDTEDPTHRFIKISIENGRLFDENGMHPIGNGSTLLFVGPHTAPFFVYKNDRNSDTNIEVSEGVGKTSRNTLSLAIPPASLIKAIKRRVSEDTYINDEQGTNHLKRCVHADVPNASLELASLVGQYIYKDTRLLGNSFGQNDKIVDIQKDLICLGEMGCAHIQGENCDARYRLSAMESIPVDELESNPTSIEHGQ